MGDCSKAVCSGLELTVAMTVCTRPVQGQASQFPSRLEEGSHGFRPLAEEKGESLCFQEEASEKLPVPPADDPILTHKLVAKWTHCTLRHTAWGWRSGALGEELEWILIKTQQNPKLKGE